MAPVTTFRTWPNLVARGWGAMSRNPTTGQWTFVPQSDQMTTVPGVTGKVHQLVAPIVDHLLRWLEAHRGRALDKDGNWGLAVRPIRGRETAAYAGVVDAWSNHSGGLAVDVEAPRNPMGVTGRGDFPPGWLEECHRYGFAWGAGVPDGDYLDRPDRMHVEFIGTPAQAREYLAQLAGASSSTTSSSAPAAPATREDDPVSAIPITVGADNKFRATAMAEGPGVSQVVADAWVTIGSTWGASSWTITALDATGAPVDQRKFALANNRSDVYDVPDKCKMLTLEGTADAGALLAAALVVKAK